MSSKTCPLCGARRGKRECPALGRTICAVCCGTKRQVEINCPPECSYLSSARAHPAAAVQRRRERDLRFVLPLVADLTEPQYRLLLAFQALVLKQRTSVVPAPNDVDVAEAAAAVAATIETERKGIIYEHQAASVPAQRLAIEIRALIADIVRQTSSPAVERDAAAALRRVEQGARTAASVFPEDAERAYLGVLDRLMSEAATQPQDERTVPGETTSGGGLIIAP